jgi:hypothetical protein
VTDRIRFHLDEHIPNVVAKALREYGIDVTTPTDAGLLQAKDHEHLAYARSNRRVMVTFDSDYTRLHNIRVEHTGIAYILPRSRKIGPLIEILCTLYDVHLPDEMINRLEYL